MKREWTKDYDDGEVSSPPRFELSEDDEDEDDVDVSSLPRFELSEDDEDHDEDADLSSLPPFELCNQPPASVLARDTELSPGIHWIPVRNRKRAPAEYDTVSNLPPRLLSCLVRDRRSHEYGFSLLRCIMRRKVELQEQRLPDEGIFLNPQISFYAFEALAYLASHPRQSEIESDIFADALRSGLFSRKQERRIIDFQVQSSAKRRKADICRIN